MTTSEPSDLALLAGWGAPSAHGGISSTCLGALLVASGQLGRSAVSALHGPEWAATVAKVLLVAGLAMWVVGAIMAHLDERRNQRRQRRCLAMLEKRYSDADALVLYSGRALPHGALWQALVVVRGEEGNLTAMASRGTDPVRNAKALLQTADVQTLLQRLEEVPKVKAPPARSMDGFQARALILGRKVPRSEVRANLEGLTEEDRTNAIVAMLGTLTTTCQQITS